MSSRPRWMRRLACLVACLGGLLPAHAGRASTPDGARLAARLDSATAADIGVILDEARRKALPTAPLVATALEGAARGVPPDRIVTAVRSQAIGLERAREALDLRADEAELVAGASALRAGVPPDSLTRLRGARGGSALIPLVVMADLITRGVPPATASGAMIAAIRAGVRDPDLLRLREHVALDIRAGASPRDAATVRMQALMVEWNRAVRHPSAAPRPALPGELPR